LVFTSLSSFSVLSFLLLYERTVKEDGKDMVVIHIIKISPPLMSSLESSDFPFLERETAAGVYYERITGRPLKATTRPTEGSHLPSLSFLLHGLDHESPARPWKGKREWPGGQVSLDFFLLVFFFGFRKGNRKPKERQRTPATCRSVWSALGAECLLSPGAFVV